MKFTKLMLSIASSVWVSIPIALKALAVVLAIEAITALVSPKANFRRAVNHLALALSLCALVHLAYFWVKTYTQINFGFDVATGVCTYYALSAAVMILRNFQDTGLVIWPPLADILLKAQGLTKDDRKVLEDISKAQ